MKIIAGFLIAVTIAFIAAAPALQCYRECRIKRKSFIYCTDRLKRDVCVCHNIGERNEAIK